ncbi:MAG: NAD(P)-binding protein [Myxococcales bacterium]|nr:NAD(P)-binding protein [Myxococcales bacterium]
MGRRKVAIIGAGASGGALAWCLATAGAEDDVVVFHDEDEVGGHSRTIPIAFDATGRARVAASEDEGPTYPVDIGVQFVCPSIYPNLYRQLTLPDFRHVTLVRHRELRMSGAFQDDLCWGNFGPYQSGERFDRCLDEETRAQAARFQRDLARAPWGKIGGRRILSMSVGEYLDASGIGRRGNFFRYLLIPYLCIINGYGTVDLLETTMEDLFPIFARIPGLQDDGPYGSFTSVGRGWDRFEHGATQWVVAMIDYAVARGTQVRTAARVERLARRGDRWVVRWTSGATYGPGGVALAPGTESHEDDFDTVVLTTDMTTNRKLLDNDDNPHWAQQRDILSPRRFRLLPGACYIHQDDTVLAPALRDGLEDGQFTGYFAWGDRDEGSTLYDLPYDLGSSFQTYLMQNVLGTPAPLYVSMYAEDRTAVVPAPDKTQFVRTWRHGRWVASFFREAKRALHRVQGLGDLWFAGNNTTIDSEEGALLSAMIIASKISPFQYPFPRLSSAWGLYCFFHEMMFPSRNRLDRIARVALGRPLGSAIQTRR